MNPIGIVSRYKRLASVVWPVTGLKARVNEMSPVVPKFLYEFPFINTGLQAGVPHCRESLAVLTASFVMPMQPVTLDKLSQFLCERFHAMMFFLVRNVSRHKVDVGMRY